MIIRRGCGVDSNTVREVGKNTDSRFPPVWDKDEDKEEDLFYTYKKIIIKTLYTNRVKLGRIQIVLCFLEGIGHFPY